MPHCFMQGNAEIHIYAVSNECHMLTWLPTNKHCGFHSGKYGMLRSVFVTLYYIRSFLPQHYPLGKKQMSFFECFPLIWSFVVY